MASTSAILSKHHGIGVRLIYCFPLYSACCWRRTQVCLVAAVCRLHVQTCSITIGFFVQPVPCSPSVLTFLYQTDAFLAPRRTVLDVCQLYPIVMLCADAMAWIFACLVVPACNLHIICVGLWEWLERVQIFHFDRYKDVGAKVFWLYILLEQSECLHRAVLGAFISVGWFPVLHRVTTPQFCVNGFQWVTARVGRKIVRESVSDAKANCW